MPEPKRIEVRGRMVGGVFKAEAVVDNIVIHSLDCINEQDARERMGVQNTTLSHDVYEGLYGTDWYLVDNLER